jgi:hypothetical protein
LRFGAALALACGVIGRVEIGPAFGGVLFISDRARR